jgi:hypothetical protein
MVEEVPVQTRTGKEIEQRFLVKYLPPEILAQIIAEKRTTIDPQAYLSDTKRIRRIINSQGQITYEKTTKTPVEADDLPAKTSIQDETESAINTLSFYRKLSKAKYQISKRRYHPDLGSAIPQGAKVDFDVFTSGSIFPWRNMRRRILVEIEFAHPEQAASFVPPEWFGKNVTDVVSTRKLAKRKFKAIWNIRRSIQLPKGRG